MKRVSLIILVCLFGNLIPGYSQLKMTRYIHQKDYIDYGNEMFSKTTIDIYLLATTGKIKAYADSSLSITYDENQLNKRIEICEEVKNRLSRNEDAGDTTVCLPLDYNAVRFWLKIKTGGEESYNFPRLPVAVFYDSSGKQKLLFYTNFQDFTKLDLDNRSFLISYIEDQCFTLDFLINLPNSQWISLNQNEMRQYIKERFKDVMNVMKYIIPSKSDKLYISDSLKTKFTPETFLKKKLELAGLSQKLDSDETIEIFLGEELNVTDNGFRIKEQSVGIGGDVQIGKSSLSDMPFFYIKYQDAMNIFAHFKNGYVVNSFDFLMDVSK